LALDNDRPSLLRTLLILGRVSNLPTVWSNCLAAWLICGGTDWTRFAILGLGCSLLYIGGMYLNDACDAGFDRQHRSERPIPAGCISHRSVWNLSVIWLSAGMLVLGLLGSGLLLPALGLLACIVVYDIIHKKTTLAPLLMAGCRFLLYLVAGAAAGGLRNDLLGSALVLGLYTLALSYVARTESKAMPVNLYALPWLLVPFLAATMRGSPNAAAATLWVLFLGWILFALYPLKTRQAGAAGVTVSRLLAGIVLVDMLAAPPGPGSHMLAFALLFGSALVLQRTVPAT
jgi:hypothetical protein